jgi:hypothetical protein
VIGWVGLIDDGLPESGGLLDQSDTFLSVLSRWRESVKRIEAFEHGKAAQ